MPSIQQKPGSPVWAATIRVWKKDDQHEKGGRWRRTQRSTGVPITEPRETALMVATEMQRQETEIATERISREDFYKRSVSRLMIAAGLSIVNDARSWQDFSMDWLMTRKGAPSTLAKYGTQIAQFSKFLGTRRREPMREITETDINEWYSAMLARGLSSGTANQALKAIRSIFRSAKERGIVSSNPATLIKMDDTTGHERRPFTPVEARTIFEYISKLPEPYRREWRIVCLFGLLYGLRIKDAVTRDYSEIRDGILTFVPLKKIRKGKKVPLPLIGELATLKGKGLITPTLAAVKLPSRHFSRILNRAYLDVRKSKKRGEKGRRQADITFHSWRHTCNSWLANAGIDGRVRQLISDHDSASENARYTQPNISVMKAAVSKVLAELSNKKKKS